MFPWSGDAADTASRLTASGYIGLPDASGQGCFYTIDGLMTSAWLRQDNVIVEVQYPVNTFPAFVDQVRTALSQSLGGPEQHIAP